MVICWCSYLGQPRAVSIYVQNSMRRRRDEHQDEGLTVGVSRTNADDSGTLETRLDYSDHVQRRGAPARCVKLQ